jgi:hypothetical protein
MTGEAKLSCRSAIKRAFLLAFFLFVSDRSLDTEAAEWSGSVWVEARLFPQKPLSSQQHDEDLSLALEPEFYHEWDQGMQSFTFVPFLRLDQHDDERTHGDIRELTWVKVGPQWELRVGIRKVFWGVTEFLHLVDIINQTDLVEDIDTEDKLGQPMINLSLERAWGIVDFFLLPYFRERTFPGPEGRLRFFFPVDTDRAKYESGAGPRHLDWALRWFHSVGDWDMGLAHFSGTGREPRLVTDLSDPQSPSLIPHYDLIDQTSMDVQATKGEWLWKLELLSRRALGERFTALTGGFEYTLIGILGTAADLGILSEYLWDDRKESVSTPFDDDLGFGFRLTLNDVHSTQVLVGIIIDRSNHARFWNLEASRRLGTSWTAALEARAFENISPEDPFFGFRKDDYIQIDVAWHF